MCGIVAEWLRWKSIVRTIEDRFPDQIFVRSSLFVGNSDEYIFFIRRGTIPDKNNYYYSSGGRFPTNTFFLFVGNDSDE